jgi:chromosome segregation ATPase
VHAKAQKITQGPGFNQDKELEKRIAALEGALHEAGGKLVNEKEHERTEDMELLRSQIAVAQGKLKSGQSKIEALKKQYGSAKQQNNKHIMIKIGTQEKDLSVEVDGLKDHIKELQSRLHATAMSSPTPSLPLIMDPAVKGVQQKVKVKLNKVKAAVAQAKDASTKRAELKKQADNMRAKLTGAEHKEKKKLEKAKKAKQDLKVSLKQASQEQQTLKHKFDQEKHQLEAQGKQIAQEEQKAKQNQALIKSKITSAQKSISALQTVAQKTDAENVNVI